MTILEDIRSNTINTLHLSSVPEDYFTSTKEFVAALKDNTSLEEVTFDKDFLGCVYGRERGLILDAVGELKNIQQVQLADVCVMVPDLVRFVQRAKGLKSFTIERLMLQGVQSDFDDLECALLQKTGLKTFHLNDCDTANVGIDMDRILNVGKNINATSIASPNQVKKSAIAA
jgi:hypothetical protein